MSKKKIYEQFILIALVLCTFSLTFDFLDWKLVTAIVDIPTVIAYAVVIRYMPKDEPGWFKYATYATAILWVLLTANDWHQYLVG